MHTVIFIQRQKGQLYMNIYSVASDRCRPILYGFIWVGCCFKIWGQSRSYVLKIPLLCLFTSHVRAHAHSHACTQGHVHSTHTHTHARTRAHTDVYTYMHTQTITDSYSQVKSHSFCAVNLYFLLFTAIQPCSLQSFGRQTVSSGPSCEADGWQCYHCSE